MNEEKLQQIISLLMQQGQVNAPPQMQLAGLFSPPQQPKYPIQTVGIRG